MPNKWERDFEDKPARTSLRAGIFIIVGIGVLSLVGVATGIVTLPFRSAAGIAERTANPDNVLANYEWFKRQVQDVRAIDVRLDASRKAQASFEASAGPRDGWKFDDRQEWSRLNAIVLGLEGQRAGMVAEYNARSQMANRSIFKTGDLPETL